MKLHHLAWFALLIFSLQGCTAAIDRESLQDQLLEADRAFSDACTEDGSAAAFAEFLAPDAVGLPNAGPPLTGRSMITEFLAADASVQLEWAPETALLSEAGDLGYTWGRLVARFPGPAGGIVASTGKYMSVWRREPNGRWRVVGYMNNSSPASE